MMPPRLNESAILELEQIKRQIESIKSARPRPLDAEVQQELADRLRKTIKLNELFDCLIGWRESTDSFATVGDMMLFYRQARERIGVSENDARDIEKAVENLYWAKRTADQLEKEHPPESPGLFERLFGFKLF